MGVLTQGIRRGEGCGGGVGVLTQGIRRGEGRGGGVWGY